MRAKCGLLGHQHQRWGRVSQEGGSTSSCPPLPANVPLAKRSLELEAVMKDASVEHGERERCNEHPTVPQSADSSINNSNECSTEPWEISGCVHDSFWKSRNRRLPSRWTPVTPALTLWDFNKVGCRTKSRKLVENSKPLLLIASPIDTDGGHKEQARGVLHLADTHLGVGLCLTH